MTDAPLQSPGLCLNCDQPLEGPFCSHCGQKSRGHDLTLGSILHDVLHDLLHLDAKILGTFRALFLKPGFLTAAYLAGKRTRYVPPFRLYIFISFVFFTLLALDTTRMVKIERSPVPASKVGFHFGIPDQAKAAKAEAKPAAPVNIEPAADTPPGPPEAAWKRHLEKELVENPARFQEHLIHRFGQMAFLLLPVFALLLKVLYLRQHRYFVEFVIFSLHFHTFGFAILALTLLLGFLLGPWGALPSFLLMLTPPIYLLLALKNLYGQSWKLTGLKAVLALTAHALVIVFALLGTVVLTAALA